MAYLFQKDCLRQSLRLGLSGAWSQLNPVQYDMLVRISDKCPRLINSFILLQEEGQADIDQTLPQRSQLYGDENLMSPALDLLQIRILHSQCPIIYNEPFLLQLRHAYQEAGQDMKSVPNIHNLQMSPCVSFNDRCR